MIGSVNPITSEDMSATEDITATVQSRAWLIPRRLSVSEGSGSQLGETNEPRDDGKEERREERESLPFSPSHHHPLQSAHPSLLIISLPQLTPTPFRNRETTGDESGQGPWGALWLVTGTRAGKMQKKSYARSRLHPVSHKKNFENFSRKASLS